MLLVISAGLSMASNKFFTIANLFNLLNTSSTNLIFAVGLLVVLIAGGIDISFAVAASVVQYVVALALAKIGGGDWFIGLAFAAVAGIALGAVNAALIYYFRIISIVVTIATFNIFFGLLMFFTHGVSIYNLPEWWTHRTVLFEFQQANGNWAELTLPVAIMAVCVDGHLGADRGIRPPAGSSMLLATIPKARDGLASISRQCISSPLAGSA